MKNNFLHRNYNTYSDIFLTGGYLQVKRIGYIVLS